MKAPRSVSHDGLVFTGGWEGWRAGWYKDIVGVWTHGYGHARKNNEPIDTVLTPEEGLTLLGSDMVSHVAPIDLLAGQVDLTHNQFNMVGDWLFNCGAGALQHSGVLAALLRGDIAAVPKELEKWCRVVINGVKQTNQGLLNRRKAEGLIFLKPDAVLPPELCDGMGECPSYQTHDICPPDEEIAARGYVILDDLVKEAMDRERREAMEKA